jgi:hypothetical protein
LLEDPCETEIFTQKKYIYSRTEADPIQEEIKKLMWKVRAQMEYATPKDKAALKTFFRK